MNKETENLKDKDQCNINSVSKRLPTDIENLIEVKATKRINVRDLNAVVVRVEDVKEIIREVLDRINVC